MRGFTEDITGKSFGKFEVLGLKGVAKSGGRVWNIKCECGTERSDYTTAIINCKTPCHNCKEKSKLNKNLGVIKKEVLDLTGTKFNTFTVISRAESIKGDRHARWLCKCNNCNNEITRSTARIKKGTTICNICKENNRVREFKPLKTRLDPDIAAFRKCYTTYKKSAKQRGLDFNLTYEQFKLITSSDCFYCGETPSNIKNGSTGGAYLYNGIDRVDNNVGYVNDNCLPCCKVCNYMKHTNSMEEFMEKIEKIHSKLIKPQNEILQQLQFMVLQ